eukprot:symbB.v1.2.029904.t1/scaffold3322.1/size91521/2
MNPHGLLIAYAEAMVKPVVSDFDTFTVGSSGMIYEPICEQQQALMRWSLERTEEILHSPSSSGWNTRWLEVLNEADRDGFHPEIPEFGFGDPTSYRLTKEVIEATKMCGAVRHGAECFNFYFPQELDSEYLIIWDGFEGKPWSYRNSAGLVEFLLARVEDGYAFPLNPVWPVRDEGWYEVFDALRKSAHAQDCLAAWFPKQSGVMEYIEKLHKQFRDGFHVIMDQAHELPDSSTANWLKLREFAICCELQTLESQLAEAAAGNALPIGIVTPASQRLEGARSELALAEQCVQRALQKDVDDEWLCIGVADDLDTLSEATELLRTGRNERDAAEANLLHQRAARIELLQRLHDVTRQNSKALEKQQLELDKEAGLEKQLRALCEERERETQEIREEVLAQGRRLDARNTVPPRESARRHMKAQQDVEEAKVILQLKRISDSHLARVQGEQNKVEQKIDNLKAKHEKKMGDLQDQWQRRKQQHEEEVEELEKELAQMESLFEARWAEEDAKLTQMLEEQEIKGQEAIAQLEAELLRQSDLLKNEVQSVHEEASLQEVDLKEVGTSLETEIKAQLEQRKQAIQDSSDADMQRFRNIRETNEKVTDGLIDEARLFQQGLAFLRDAYSNTPRKMPHRPTGVTLPSPSPYGK